MDVRIPLCCPTCHGLIQRNFENVTVSKPPWILGNAELYPCPSCSGTGIVWTEIQNEESVGD